MKSKLTQVPPSDVFITDTIWMRLEIDNDDLCYYLRRGDVQGLVRELLDDKFSHCYVFPSLVVELTTVVWNKIAELIKVTKDGKPVVVTFNRNIVDYVENVRNKNDTMFAKPAAYWVGDRQ